MGPLVSVIVPARARPGLLKEALESVLEQSYRPLDLVVVEDGPQDSLSEVATWCADAAERRAVRCLWVQQPERAGAAAARNRGLDVACGEVVQFLDDDDLLPPGKIARQVSVAAARPSTLPYGPWRFLRVGLHAGWELGPVQQEQPIAPGVDPLALHLEGWFCPPHAYLWPRELLERLGGWDASLAADQDGDLVMRALLQGPELVHVPNEPVLYRIHGGAQTSASTGRSAARSRMRVIRKLARMLDREGRLDDYRTSLAARCGQLARGSAATYPELAACALREMRALAPGYEPPVHGRLSYRLVRRVGGLFCAERLAYVRRRLTGAR